MVAREHVPAAPVQASMALLPLQGRFNAAGLRVCRPPSPRSADRHSEPPCWADLAVTPDSPYDACALGRARATRETNDEPWNE